MVSFYILKPGPLRGRHTALPPRDAFEKALALVAAQWEINPHAPSKIVYKYTIWTESTEACNFLDPRFVVN